MQQPWKIIDTYPIKFCRELLDFAIKKFDFLLHCSRDNHRKCQIYNIMNPLPTKPDNVHLKCKYWSKSLTSKFHHNRRNTFLKVDISMLKIMP